MRATSGEEYNVIAFGIPADHTFVKGRERLNTCPGAKACRGVCFAKQGGYRFPGTIKAREHNLALTLSPGFVEMVVEDLSRKRAANTIRIHDSGDFYSQGYFDKWCAIARALPHLTFFAYTKSLHLNLSGAPDNLKVTQSLGGKHDALVNLRRPHSRIFASHAARKRARYIDGNVSDAPAIQGLVKIGLVYHGNKNLTASQKKFFG